MRRIIVWLSFAIRENRVPKNTRQSTQFAVNLFQTWREQHAKLGQRYDPLDCGVPQLLNALVRMFIVEIRRKDGLPYHPESVKSIFFGINRYLIEQDATMNMISAPEFLTCRQKVDGYIKKLQYIWYFSLLENNETQSIL